MFDDAALRIGIAAYTFDLVLHLVFSILYQTYTRNRDRQRHILDLIFRLSIQMSISCLVILCTPELV